MGGVSTFVSTCMWSGIFSDGKDMHSFFHAHNKDLKYADDY
jgi:hypothetical protein